MWCVGGAVGGEVGVGRGVVGDVVVGERGGGGGGVGGIFFQPELSPAVTLHVSTLLIEDKQ